MSKNIKVTRPEPVKPEGVVISEVVLRNVDRTMKDVRSWRNAYEIAASVYTPNRTRLYDLYDDVRLDGHLSGIISRRNAAVRNKNFRFVDNKTGQQVEGMENFLRSKCFRDLITEIMEAKAWGISALEFDAFSKTPAFTCIPRKHVKPEYKIISIEQQGVEGYDYTKLPNVWVVGDTYDYGYLLRCCFYALIKKGDFSDWAQYVEIFGQPIRVARYQAHDVITKTALRAALDEAGSSLALMLPKEADFELIDGKQSNGDGKLQQALKDSCNDEMSMVVLTNTETSTGANGGSLAKAKEQGKQQLDITKDDIMYALTYLNDEKFLTILEGYGLPIKNGRFEAEKDIDLASLTLKANIDTIVAEKVPINDDYWYTTYQIPKPENYDELKADFDAMQQAKMAAMGQGTASQEKAELQGKQEGNKENSKQQRQQAQKEPTNKKVGNASAKEQDSEKGPANANLSAWHKMRMQLADFFAHGHKG